MKPRDLLTLIIYILIACSIIGFLSAPVHADSTTTIIDITGDDNLVNIQQVGGNGHYVNVSVNGSVNNVDILQTTTGSDKHYLATSIIGGSNSLILKQSDSSKTATVSVDGSNNTVSTDQKGSGNHLLDLKITGNNHLANVLQDGSGSHKANAELGGTQPWNFNLNQNSNSNQTYGSPQAVGGGSCYTVGGCSLTINQQ